MVRSVDDDTRGIVNPAELLRHVSFVRHAPSSDLQRFVSWFWVIRWSLPPGRFHTQGVVSHPVVNLTFTDGTAMVNGVHRTRQSQRLEGTSWVIGVMFRPAGFRPFLGAPLSSLSGLDRPMTGVFGEGASPLIDAVFAAGPSASSLDAVDRFLVERKPSGRHAAEDTTQLVEEIADDRSITRVDQLSELTGESSRQLQRRFADHVGASPKAVVRQYRIYEVGERAARGDDIDWAALAADLGYADQAHLSRDFTSAFGLSPGRYLERCRAARRSAGSDDAAAGQIQAESVAR